MLFHKISIPLPRKVFWFKPPPPPTPPEFPLKAHTFLLKFWLLRPPTPLEFPLTFHGVGMDIFWNCTFQHIATLVGYFVRCCEGAGQTYATLCGSRKYPYSPPQKGLEIPGRRGGGGSGRAKNLKQCMKLNWNFRRGGGITMQIPSVGGMDIFCNHTFQETHHNTVMHNILHMLLQHVRQHIEMTNQTGAYALAQLYCWNMAK